MKISAIALISCRLNFLLTIIESSIDRPIVFDCKISYSNDYLIAAISFSYQTADSISLLTHLVSIQHFKGDHPFQLD